LDRENFSRVARLVDEKGTSFPHIIEAYKSIRGTGEMITLSHEQIKRLHKKMIKATGGPNGITQI
jgi:hypothetical protein